MYPWSLPLDYHEDVHIRMASLPASPDGSEYSDGNEILTFPLPEVRGKALREGKMSAEAHRAPARREVP
jgi:hypothetical protein